MRTSPTSPWIASVLNCRLPTHPASSSSQVTTAGLLPPSLCRIPTRQLLRRSRPTPAGSTVSSVRSTTQASAFTFWVKFDTTGRRCPSPPWVTSATRSACYLPPPSSSSDHVRTSGFSRRSSLPFPAPSPRTVVFPPRPVACDRHERHRLDQPQTVSFLGYRMRRLPPPWFASIYHRPPAGAATIDSITCSNTAADRDLLLPGAALPSGPAAADVPLLLPVQCRLSPCCQTADVFLTRTGPAYLRVT